MNSTTNFIVFFPRKPDNIIALKEMIPDIEEERQEEIYQYLLNEIQKKEEIDIDTEDFSSFFIDEHIFNRYDYINKEEEMRKIPYINEVSDKIINDTIQSFNNFSYIKDKSINKLVESIKIFNDIYNKHETNISLGNYSLEKAAKRAYISMEKSYEKIRKEKTKKILKQNKNTYKYYFSFSNKNEGIESYLEKNNIFKNLKYFINKEEVL
jgi:hypothetical protein